METTISDARARAKVNMGKVAEMLPAIVAVYNINSGEYLYVNKTLQDILGYAPDEFLEGGIEYVTGLVHPSDLSNIMGKNQRAVEKADRPRTVGDDKPNIVSFEYRVRHKKGHWVYLQTNGSVFSRSTDGKVEEVLNVSIDITERKEAENKLKAKTAHLSDINRSKDEFVAIASHQLRTPATAVRQYLGLLLEGYTDPLTEGQKQFLQEAYENNERQLQIVNDILQVARLDLNKITLNLQRRDIVKKVVGVVRDLKDKLDVRGQEIIVHKPKSSPKVLVDPTLIRGVVENILDNASKYSPTGRNVEVSFNFYSDFVAITVKDAGVGIDESDFPRLFQKFSRIENPLSIEVGGTGLGLYWASKIVSRHGGMIKVHSRVGEGSVFTIVLPIDGPGNSSISDKQERLLI